MTPSITIKTQHSISVLDIVMLSVANKLIDVERLGDLVAILKTSRWRQDIQPNDIQHELSLIL